MADADARSRMRQPRVLLGAIAGCSTGVSALLLYTARLPWPELFVRGGSAFDDRREAAIN